MKPQLTQWSWRRLPRSPVVPRTLSWSATRSDRSPWVSGGAVYVALRSDWATMTRTLIPSNASVTLLLALTFAQLALLSPKQLQRAV